MKRGGRLVRKTELRAKTPFKSGGFLKRGAFVAQSAIKAKRPKVTSEERLARKLVRDRSGGICEICQRARSTNFQHRLSRAHNGPWTAANGLAVCGQGNASGCHGHIHQNPKAAIEQGWTIRSTDRRDPSRVPVWLGGHGYCWLNNDGSISEAPEEEEAA